MADVQKRLVERNALPEDVLSGNGLGSILPPDAVIKNADVTGLLKFFGTPKESHAIPGTRQAAAARVHAELKRVVREGADNEQLMAASVLALKGLTDGVEVLQKVVRIRRPDTAIHNRNLSRYMGAFFLLDDLGLLQKLVR